jgi:hypothetical protein
MIVDAFEETLDRGLQEWEQVVVSMDLTALPVQRRDDILH